MKFLRTWACVIAAYVLLFALGLIFCNDLRAMPAKAIAVAPDVKPVYFVFYYCGKLVAVAGNNANYVTEGIVTEYMAHPESYTKLLQIKDDAIALDNAHVINITSEINQGEKCR